MFANDQSGTAPVNAGGPHHTAVQPACSRRPAYRRCNGIRYGRGCWRTFSSATTPASIPTRTRVTRSIFPALVAGGGTFQVRFAEVDNQSFIDGCRQRGRHCALSPQRSRFSVLASPASHSRVAASSKQRQRHEGPACAGPFLLCGRKRPDERCWASCPPLSAD
jgi:hypothetical protein